ncbi:MAG TPA: hypothetical protein VM597_03680 [Gemmataceae bacterium]|nr:hypothetical protein [Gemmataceae bacterium]
MRILLRHRLAALIAGLGFTATGLAAPPRSAKDDPPVIKAPKADPKPVQPKFEPKPLPKPEPKPLPKFEPKPVVLPKAEPKPLPPIVLPKPVVKLPAPDAKPVPKPLPVTKPVVGLKPPAGKKFDPAEVAKIKPPIDLAKTKPEVVLASKPPKDFKAKPIALDQIQVPKTAAKVAKLNAGLVSATQGFVLNQNAYVGNGYHTTYGVKTAFGFAYPGQWHSHWHHCVWDPCFKCHYYYCPSIGCYYYWNPVDVCYYPCHWFVDYGPYYYPWWIGYQGPNFSFVVKW